MVSSKEEIEAIFNLHFQQLFQPSNPSQDNMKKGTYFVKMKVSKEMNINLTKHFVKEKVERALKQIAHLKSPGPDNFNPSFYKIYWHILGKEATLVALKFLNEGLFDPCINFTYIVLILKINALLMF